MNAERMARQMRFSACSAGFNLLIAAAKLAIGLFGTSLLLCLHAFCNVGMATAKLTAVKSHRAYGKTDDSRPDSGEEWLCCLHMGLIVAGSSLIFLLYGAAVRHFGYSPAYSFKGALLIAVVSFTEIGIAVFGMFVAGRAKKPLVTAIKLTNLAFSLFTLALVQTAILSFKEQQDHSAYNGMIAMVLGGVSLLIGLGMAMRASYKLQEIGEADRPEAPVPSAAAAIRFRSRPRSGMIVDRQRPMPDLIEARSESSDEGESLTCITAPTK
ncbi:hypothetical protein [Saccharibacillus alkalitolerans]|uniref:Uncharacterized protein n=1 Tax=Saccharibacillus alkalitolerans TaxID=2705290 RepID=A0ABX0F5P3_9BACL|nr:hypothetical protein [Saccharibacillus alkalitolerans]NGZ75240.1 hypothetical protein [Saccharibacillus alkalitolerans]